MLVCIRRLPRANWDADTKGVPRRGLTHGVVAHRKRVGQIKLPSKGRRKGVDYLRSAPGPKSISPVFSRGTALSGGRSGTHLQGPPGC